MIIPFAYANGTDSGLVLTPLCTVSLYFPRSTILLISAFAWFIAASAESSPLLAFERKIPKAFSISFHRGVRGRGRELSSERSCAGYEGNLATSCGSLKTDLRVGGFPRCAEFFICSALVAHNR